MKLTLNNFRCYEYITLDFGEKGVVLLNGPSGIGKTTILLGILFVLFDKCPKPIKHDKSSCSGEIEFNNMIIKRIKKPNSLILTMDGHTYQDDIAQNIINNRFGKMFDVTGYMSQTCLKSFTLMSAPSKLEFLESFAFDDVDITELKEKTKANIKIKNDRLVNSSAIYNTLKQEHDKLQKPVSYKYPLKKKDIPKSIIKQARKLENQKTINNNIKVCIEDLTNELNELKVLNAKITTTNEMILTIEDKICNETNELENIVYIGDNKLVELEHSLQTIIDNRELLSIKSKYEDDSLKLNQMKNSEIETIKTKINTIQSTLWKPNSLIEVDASLKELKDVLSDATLLESLQKDCNCKYSKNDLEQMSVQIDELTKTIENKKVLLSQLELKQRLLNCPKCDTKLVLNDGKLEECELHNAFNNLSITNISSDIKELCSKLLRLQREYNTAQSQYTNYETTMSKIRNIKEQYESEIQSVSSLHENIKRLTTYKQQQLNNELKLKELEKYEMPSNIQSFEKSLNRQLLIIQSKEQNISETISDRTEDELRSIINSEKRNKELIVTKTALIKTLNSEKCTYVKKIDNCKSEFIESFGEIRDIPIVEHELQVERDKLSESDKLLNELIELAEKIEKYKTYVEEKRKYNLSKENVSNAKKQEINDYKAYQASLLLQVKITECENISIASVIDSINVHTQVYLDTFFNEHPLSAFLTPEKETKTTKTVKQQLNIQVEYKNMSSDLSILSGGELSRVILANTLALGEIFNTPLVLLDECTSSVEQDLSNDIIECIKEHCSNKLVIVIAHQCVSGIFDKVISL